MQPIRHGLNWWFWCGHEALSTLPFCCTRPHSPFKTLTSLLGVLTAFGISCAFWRDLGGTADVHGTLGGIYGCLRNLRGPARSANEPSGCGMETLTDFDGFLWIPTESGGSWRDFAEPLGFRWVCADACPTSVRGILFFKWSGCLTICELCCVPTSCPVYCLVLPLPVSPPPQKSTSKICKLLPVVTSNVKKNQRHQIRKTGFPKTGVFLFLNLIRRPGFRMTGLGDRETWRVPPAEGEQ